MGDFRFCYTNQKAENMQKIQNLARFALALALLGLLQATLHAQTPTDLKGLREIEKQVQSTVKKVLPTVVGMSVGSGWGSGVIVSKDGYVMTAAHVVDEPGQEVTFFLHDGTKVKGVTLGHYLPSDAGLAKINGRNDLPFSPRGKSDDIEQGDWCIAMGHSNGYFADRPAVARTGRVLQVAELLLRTDCPIVGGDSGGPLFNLKGEVIGINSRIGPQMQMNIHAPVDTFSENWDRMVKKEKIKPATPSRDCKVIRKAVTQLLNDVSQNVCSIKCNGKRVAFGTIVGPNGWVATKASEVVGKGPIICKVKSGQEHKCELVGVSKKDDLAMLKIDARGFPALSWTKEEPGVGSWIAVPGPDGLEPVAMGMVGVPPRKIAKKRAMLGVVLVDVEKKGAKIDKIFPMSPAADAKLKEGDLITHINNSQVKSRDEVVAKIKGMSFGTIVKIKVLRDGKSLVLSPALGKIETAGTKKADMQNKLGVGGRSERRDDFAKVLQHDAPLRPTDCGGPVVNLDGKVVGINIARAGRTETFVIPTSVLMEAFYPLTTGMMPAEDLKKKAEAEAKKKAEAEAKKKAEAEAKKKAEAEAKKKAEAEAKKKAEAEAKKKAEAEAKKKAEAEAKKKAEAEAKKKAEAEAKKKAEAEAKKKANEEKE